MTNEGIRKFGDGNKNTSGRKVASKASFQARNTDSDGKKHGESTLGEIQKMTNGPFVVKHVD